MATGVNRLRGDLRTLGCCAVLVVLTAVASAFAGSPTLTRDQQRRLHAREVVLLDVLPPGASESAQGGTAVAFVCAPASAVWAVLVDWRNHPALYPHVTRARVTQTDPPRVRVRYTLAVGPFSFDIFMDKYPDAMRRRMMWRLAEDRPSTFLAESSGYWHVDEAGAESRVTYAVATRTLVPALLTRGSQRDSLVSTVQALRRLAQKATGNDARSPCAIGR